MATTDITGMLKAVYSDEGIEELQNKSTETWKRIPKASKKPAGTGFEFSVNLKGNQRGTGAINELESLRQAQHQTPRKAVVNVKINETTVKFSGLELEAAKGNEDSFADNKTFQMDRSLEDLSKELNAQLYRDGLGRLAQVNGAVAASDTITVDNGALTHFREGMFVDVWDGVTKEVDSREVLSIDLENSQIVLDQAVTCSDDAYIYREDVNDEAPTEGKEIQGFPMVTDDGTLSTTYLGISRSTYPKWRGINIDAGGANLSNDLLQRAESRKKIQSGGQKTRFIASNEQQFRKYLDVVIPLKRFKKGEKMDSGYEAVPAWNGIEWVRDTDCRFDEIYLIGEHVERFELFPIRFDTTDGKALKWDGGDTFTAYAKTYNNIGSRIPESNVRITNLAVPSY